MSLARLDPLADDDDVAVGIADLELDVVVGHALQRAHDLAALRQAGVELADAPARQADVQRPARRRPHRVRHPVPRAASARRRRATAARTGKADVAGMARRRSRTHRRTTAPRVRRRRPRAPRSRTRARRRAARRRSTPPAGGCSGPSSGGRASRSSCHAVNSRRNRSTGSMFQAGGGTKVLRASGVSSVAVSVQGTQGGEVGAEQVGRARLELFPRRVVQEPHLAVDQAGVGHGDRLVVALRLPGRDGEALEAAAQASDGVAEGRRPQAQPRGAEVGLVVEAAPRSSVPASNCSRNSASLSISVSCAPCASCGA